MGKRPSRRNATGQPPPNVVEGRRPLPPSHACIAPGPPTLQRDQVPRYRRAEHRGRHKADRVFQKPHAAASTVNSRYLRARIVCPSASNGYANTADKSQPAPRINGFVKETDEAIQLFHDLEELGHGTVTEGKQGNVTFTFRAAAPVSEE